MSALAEIRSALIALGLGPEHGEQRILVAHSGGPDSTALLVALAELTPELKLELTAHHVRHGLRTDAQDAADADSARSSARRVGVPFTEESVDVSDLEARGPEERARLARYDSLRRQAEAVSARFIATGHHAEDNLETSLIRLVRGAGLDGMAGIEPLRPLTDEIDLIRPLLGLARDTLQALLVGSVAAVDPTNRDERFLRNRIRRRVLDPLVGVREGALAAATRTLANLRRDRNALSDLERVLFAMGTITEEPAYYFPLKRALRLGEAALARLIRLAALTVAEHVPTAAAIARGLERVLGPGAPGRNGLWNDGRVALGRDGHFMVVRASNAVEPARHPEVPLVLPGGGFWDECELAFVPVGEEWPCDWCRWRVRVPADLGAELRLVGAVDAPDALHQDSRTIRKRLAGQGVPRPWRRRAPVLVDESGRALALVGGRSARWLRHAPHHSNDQVLVMRSLPWYVAEPET